MATVEGLVSDPIVVQDNEPHWLHSLCLWSWAVCGLGFGIFLVGFARFIPPPGEGWSAAHIAGFYASNRTGIRIGVLGAMFSSAFLLPYFAVVSKELSRMEGGNSLLAPIQLGGGIILVSFFQLVSLLWLLASLRPGADPQLIRFANDLCWLIWALLIPTYILQLVCLAIGAFIDRRPDRSLPHWSGYMNVLVAISGSSGVGCVFVKTGPFAWDGVVGFWVPVFGFGIGMTIDMVLLLRSHRREMRRAVGNSRLRERISDAYARP